MLGKEILIQILHLSKFPTSACLLPAAKLGKSFIELYKTMCKGAGIPGFLFLSKQRHQDSVYDGFKLFCCLFACYTVVI